MPKCPPKGGVRLQEVSVSGGSTVRQYSCSGGYREALGCVQPSGEEEGCTQARETCALIGQELHHVLL